MVLEDRDSQRVKESFEKKTEEWKKKWNLWDTMKNLIKRLHKQKIGRLILSNHKLTKILNQIQKKWALPQPP